MLRCQSPEPEPEPELKLDACSWTLDEYLSSKRKKLAIAACDRPGHRHRRRHAKAAHKCFVVLMKTSAPAPATAPARARALEEDIKALHASKNVSSSPLLYSALLRLFFPFAFFFCILLSRGASASASASAFESSARHDYRAFIRHLALPFSLSLSLSAWLHCCCGCITNRV